MPLSKLARFLGLNDEQLEASGIGEDLLEEDTGNSGDMVYSYYFNVPEGTTEEVLNAKDWEVGERIELPHWFFDEVDIEDIDGWEDLPDSDRKD